MKLEATAEPYQQGAVRGFLHMPAATPKAGLVLTHGAGGNCSSPLLLQLSSEFASLGVAALRCDLFFRQQRSAGPPHRSTAEADRNGLREALLQLRNMIGTPVFLGGHSYGGRQASLLAAEDQSVARALLLLSYPLHPPGKPDAKRTAHFPQLVTPVFFVHGTRDPFGSIEDVSAALALLPANTPVKLLPLEGQGHDLSARGTDASTLCAQGFLEFVKL